MVLMKMPEYNHVVLHLGSVLVVDNLIMNYEIFIEILLSFARFLLDILSVRYFKCKISKFAVLFKLPARNIFSLSLLSIFNLTTIADRFSNSSANADLSLPRILRRCRSLS